ncbi:PucR family transcriptional regulator [Nocardia coubleae]|uniref:PucR family transcriptional regulator n=3 Tax=Nocardia coubleae TaxID=356147 RepID=A0A846VZM1_9NOCA|nr:PucR family transcriptional regulator [Nocardia coubleae]
MTLLAEMRPTPTMTMFDTSAMTTPPSAQISRATQRIVDGVLHAIRPHNAHSDVLRDEIHAVVRECLELVSGARGHDVRAALHPAAARWATTGVPIETVHRLVQTGFRVHLNDHTSNPRQHKNLGDVAKIMEAMHTVDATIYRVYLEVDRFVADHHGRQAVARALLSGRNASAIAREHGTPLTERYLVLSVATHSSGQRTLSPGNFVEMLEDLFTQPISALHSTLGGTVLIHGTPDTETIRHMLTRTSLIVIAIEAARDGIPAATEVGHELLDVARRLRKRPGLYHFDDLAVEYQLTRPGPGRDHLETALDAVAVDPELVTTLRVHLNNGLHRRLTAREMHIHENTVDYRLRRIYRLAGLDPRSPELITRLRAAMTVREYMQAARSHRADEADGPPS